MDDDDPAASLCIGGRPSSEGQECRVIFEQTHPVSPSAVLYLGQDLRLSLSTLRFKTVLSRQAANVQLIHIVARQSDSLITFNP